MPDTTPALLLHLSPQDNVAVATTALAADQEVSVAGRTIVVAASTPLGYKLAVAPIAAGEKVVKYGAPIGSATCPIAPGEMVHTHNMKSDYLPTYTLDGQNPYLAE